MKTASFISLVAINVLLIPSTQNFAIAATSPTNWAQPNVGCVEELYPHLPSDHDCDQEISTPEQMDGCDLKSAVAAEIQNPAIQVDWNHWMMMHVFINREQKIETIYRAAKKYGMPPQVLYGVINLEGSMTDLGVISDMANFSCGTGSVNITQWCQWMSSLSLEEQAKVQWPTGMHCDEDTLPPEIVGAVFNHADFSKSATVPSSEYKDTWQIQLRPAQAMAVRDETILTDLKFQFANPDNYTRDELRLQAIRSFTNHCGDIQYSIPAIAYSLRDVYNRLVPESFKTQVYPSGQTFLRTCKYSYDSRDYPMSAGWLLAYGIHNEGEDLGLVLETPYFKKKLAKISHPITVADFRSIFESYDEHDYQQSNFGIGFKALLNISHVLSRMTLDKSDPSRPVIEN